MSKEKIRLLIVDDHPIIGEGLEFFLNLDPGLIVLGKCETVHKGLDLLARLNPEVVVLDYSMPDLPGAEAIRMFLQADPRLIVVVFSGHKEEKVVYQALQAGARGYVLKGSPPEELIQAIKVVHQGGY